jgi:hypothetical protein
MWVDGGMIHVSKMWNYVSIQSSPTSERTLLFSQVSRLRPFSFRSEQSVDDDEWSIGGMNLTGEN